MIRQRDWYRRRNGDSNRVWSRFHYGSRCGYTPCTAGMSSDDSSQVEEKRTPLQLRMDELAQKLSVLSFGVIGVICIIGVLQSRSWLEMFTIGGECPDSWPYLHSPRFDKRSVTCCCRHPRGASYRHHGYTSSRSLKNVQAEGHRKEIALGRIVRVGISHLFR